jgi:hypothetical protein
MDSVLHDILASDREKPAALLDSLHKLQSRFSSAPKETIQLVSQIKGYTVVAVQLL